ncbi:FAD-dependent monooxygenase [Streptomyces celluloflavus]|uniref:FAD-dependent monooxygenase n=1 Tax=Streptomyces celluloflavus TaxID=58344 RepID=UPI0036826935
MALSVNAPSRSGGTALQFRRPHLAVVLGGGFTGMLAASALTAHADVVVVERERLPWTPVPCTDLPQPRHAHLLAAAGARRVEDLLPGTLARWLAEGARRVPLSAGLVGRSLPVRSPHQTQSPYLIACSRDLLDRVAQQQAAALPGVTVLDGTEAEGLSGTAEHVTGVRVRDTVTGETYRLDADLVVDATGRNSATPGRLAALGMPAVREEAVDPGIVCATRIFRAPAGTENCPVISVRSAAGTPPAGGGAVPGSPVPPGPRVPERTATLVPIEGGRWLVTLTGGRGGQPSGHADRFVPFARSMEDPVVGDLIAGAEPLSEVRLSRDTASHLRRYEQLASWPTGFVVLGGAVAACHPDYGQGLSLAAHGAAALRDTVHHLGLDDPALARCLQRSIGRIVQASWAQATGQGVHSPAVRRRPAGSGVVSAAVYRALPGAAARSAVCPDYVDVAAPAVPTARFPSASSALGSARGTARPGPAGPPPAAAVRDEIPPGGPQPPMAPRIAGPADAEPPPGASGAAPGVSAAPAGSAAAARSATPAGQGPPAAPPYASVAGPEAVYRPEPADASAAVPPVPPRPAAEHPARRLPRPLSLGPTALRRTGRCSRRKPAG